MANILKIKKLIDEADTILIGAGSGLSNAAGITYSGAKFESEFADYIKKYNFEDLYTSLFYEFKTEEQRWPYLAKHINYAYYQNRENELYQDLLDVIKHKDYFVITTNTDGLFINNGFIENKVFEVHGTYSKLQCAIGCHNKLYDNYDLVERIIDNTNKDLEIEKSLVPKCPLCNGKMNINLRFFPNFVEDAKWYLQQKRYEEYIDNLTGKKVLILEFGSGFKYPGVIRVPFEQLTFLNHSATLIRFNRDYPDVPNEIRRRSISITDDIGTILKLLKKL